ncbi:biotin-dependent carboxyltransferase family protein [Nocardioides mesophilus]|uniref:Biotin-dependent carboxyltransferase family protein n=1 Tax=Nocardioides mesophilus TaxID=433659 RepID=A0A7G9R8R6_9ACTN|nr:biotin-dependent carboxyltransferase family protein [Nocardioides mesophilus]QNN51991.1 biotin-dependent carboxyltransferase family protein [Nocardioides mesophilus]
MSQADSTRSAGRPARVRAAGPALRVRRTGPLALVEDLGRHGLSAIGVGRSGAADRAALCQANRALANPEGAAAVEVTLGGLEVQVVGGPVWLCVTGAPTPVHVDDREVGPYAVVPAGDGAVVRLGTPPRGLRSYLAVRGGLDVPDVLGSRSHDVMAGLGPAPLAEGDLLRVGPAPATYPSVDHLPPLVLDDEVVLDVVRGPRDAWVRDVEQLVALRWRASERSNRIGMRLSGGAIAHLDADRQLPSEGACRGAVQVPPSGEPVLFLADHPVTAGYPVVAVVVDAHVDRAAQVRPGQAVSFRWVRA